MKNLNPAVVIKAEDTYYLYPKNKRNNAKLVKLDNVGYLFYKKMVECSTKEEVIAEICKKFNVQSGSLCHRLKCYPHKVSYRAPFQSLKF